MTGRNWQPKRPINRRVRNSGHRFGISAKRADLLSDYSIINQLHRLSKEVSYLQTVISQLEQDLEEQSLEHFNQITKEAIKTEIQNDHKVLSKKFDRLGDSLARLTEETDQNFSRDRSVVASIRSEFQSRATKSTADYVEQNMNGVQSVFSKQLVLKAAMDQIVHRNGLVMEFGVGAGSSANFIAENIDGTLEAFDSFEGLPEAWRDGFDVAHFKQSEFPQVPANVNLHAGWFAESIPQYLERNDLGGKTIGFLHVDCDLYSSTKTIFDLLGNMIKPGTIIVFDEYFNYHGWEQGEYLAFQEFLEKTQLSYEYLTFNFKHEQVAVRITSEQK